MELILNRHVQNEKIKCMHKAKPTKKKMKKFGRGVAKHTEHIVEMLLENLFKGGCNSNLVYQLNNYKMHFDPEAATGEVFYKISCYIARHRCFPVNFEKFLRRPL